MATPEKLIDNMYLIKKSRNIYIPLEDLDIGWDEADLPKVRLMWEKGMDIWDIAKEVGRKGEKGVYEVFLLLMDQAMRGKIKRRPGGIFGKKGAKNHAE